MNKLPLVVISSDWHIKPDNTEQIIYLINQKIELAKSLELDYLICLGDVFQSRQAQPLIVFKCFEKILDLIGSSDMILYCISGNHEKTNYLSSHSFLDQFIWHPTLKLIKTYEDIDLFEGIRFHFISFFKEELWIEKFKEVSILKNGKNILFSHQALSGSVNNDGSKQENSIKVSDFEIFDKVFLGHFHNTQQISENIFHLPSIQANNYGEDNNKGFTVLYDDLSHEIINSKFPEYHTININLDKLSKQELNDLKKEGSELIKTSGANIRFKVSGSEDKVQALKKEDFESVGIDIQKEHKSITKSIKIAETGEIMVYTDEIIKNKFNDFCKEENYEDVEYGMECLITKLKS